MSRVGAYLLLSSAACLAVGALSFAVAAMERRRGSAWWVPAAGGVLLVAVSAIRLLVVRA
jgi:hypothetical protein